MGRTRLGQSAPYCIKCENYVGNLRDKFGSPCPKCGVPTVEYDSWIRQRTDLAALKLKELRQKGRMKQKAPWLRTVVI